MLQKKWQDAAVLVDFTLVFAPFLSKTNFYYFLGGVRSERGALGVGAQARAQLWIASRSTTRSATPKIEPERDWSATPIFAGALILWFWDKTWTFSLDTFLGSSRH